MSNVKNLLTAGIAAVALTATVLPAMAGVEDTDQQREARWQDLQKQIFGDKTATADDKAIQLDAPQRAEDAALVPIIQRNQTFLCQIETGTN